MIVCFSLSVLSQSSRPQVLTVSHIITRSCSSEDPPLVLEQNVVGITLDLGLLICFTSFHLVIIQAV